MPDPEQPLVIEVSVSANEAVLTLIGELDPHTAPMLDEEIAGVRAEGTTAVVLDLGGLGFMDSSGLRVIIAANADLEEQGGSLSLRAPSDTVRRLLEITGLVDHIRIV